MHGCIWFRDIKLLILNPLDATWPRPNRCECRRCLRQQHTETHSVINWLYLCGGSRWVGDCVGYPMLFISERKNAFIGGKYWINTNAWAFPLPNHAERKKQQQHYSMWYSGFPSPLPPASRSRYGHFRCCFAFDNVDKEFDGASWKYNECYIMRFQNSFRGEHSIIAWLKLTLGLMPSQLEIKYDAAETVVIKNVLIRVVEAGKCPTQFLRSLGTYVALLKPSVVGP